MTDTPLMAPDASYPKMLRDFFFGKIPGQVPDRVLPSVRRDLKSLDPEVPSITWFGHSSYLLTLNGKFILVDPVFSDRASPFSFVGTRAFAGSNPYTIDDLPNPDVVILTHDHYDHLDYTSIMKLRSRAGLFCTSLGVGAHLEFWGVESSRIREFDWWEHATVFPGLELTAAPARHFSGRAFARNKTLWSSFLLKSGGKTLFLGGDSGYDSAFKLIGEHAGPIDLAILECGQYDRQWPNIHMMPEQTAQAGIDLKAKAMMAVHWGKFKLANHPWTDPAERVSKAAESNGILLAGPIIGEPMPLDSVIRNNYWWRNVEPQVV